MSRLLAHLVPFPVLSASLALTWLLLNAPLTPGTGLLALIVGLTVPAVMRALQPGPIHLKAPGTIVRLIGCVLYDMLRSNIDVARLILTQRTGARRTGFVTVELTLRHPVGLAVLAIILTGTPGTLWVQFDSNTGHLLIHVLDLQPEDDWPFRIKDRYEKPLMEIFA